jgi:hypothetical protein
VFRRRILIATTDERLRRWAALPFAETGCEVLTAGTGTDCVEKARLSSPDLLVLIPPLLWGSVDGVLAVVREDAETRSVPVLVLNPAADSVFPHVPRLFAPEPAVRVSPLADIVERAWSWVRARSRPVALARAPDGGRAALHPTGI